MGIDPNWLARPFTEVAPDLVGCWLIRGISMDLILRGLIVETKAYAPRDLDCQWGLDPTSAVGDSFHVNSNRSSTEDSVADLTDSPQNHPWQPLPSQPTHPPDEDPGSISEMIEITTPYPQDQLNL